MRPFLKFMVFLGLLSGIIGCRYAIRHGFRQDYKDTGALMHADSLNKTFLKAHMRNGDLYIFTGAWAMTNDKTEVTGDAVWYDFKRSYKGRKTYSVPVADVAIYETNEPIKNKDAVRITALAIVTGADLAGDLYCALNPKACFGSCPTFYYKQEGNVNYANAEGFSSAISPALEEDDIDALNNAERTGGAFELTMKNEALETHAVNQVAIYAAPRRAGHRIFNTKDGSFYDCSGLKELTMATAGGKDITAELSNADEREYYSTTDSNDLGKKETIELTFANDAGEGGRGLVLNFRQTLVTTFLLYTAYGYMGDAAGDLFAMMENSSLVRRKAKNPYELMGGIDIEVYNERGAWQKVRTIYETGPIARNLQYVALPQGVAKQKQVKVRLVAAKGCWRIDYAALATGAQQVEPVKVHPTRVVKNGADDSDALSRLAGDDDAYETSLPGDRYRLFFQLPSGDDDYEVFVYSKGYYLEWIRKEWLKEKDLPALGRMLRNDAAQWQVLARQYKQVEGKMEATFWSSKISGSVTK